MLCPIFNSHSLCLNLVHLEPLKSFQGPIKELHLPWSAEHWDRPAVPYKCELHSGLTLITQLCTAHT